MHRLLGLAGIFAVSILWIGVNASRGDSVVAYTDPASFAAQTSGLSTITFDGIIGPGSSADLNNQTLTVMGVTFSGLSTVVNGGGTVSVLSLIDPGGFVQLGLGSGFFITGGVVTNQAPLSLDGTMFAALPANVTEVSMQIGIDGVYNIPLHVDAVTAAGDHFVTIPPPGDGPPGSFIGFTSDDPITQILVSGLSSDLSFNQGLDISIDNFSFGSPLEPLAAPLPASAAAGGVLFAAMGLAHLARRRGWAA